MKKWWISLFKNHKGFTLVELICTVAIFSIVVTGVGSAMVISARSYRNGNVELDLQQQAQITSNLLTNLIIDADKVVSASGSILEIEKVESGVTVTYQVYQDGNRIVYTKGGSAPQTLAENVTSFSISNAGGNDNVDFTLGFASTDGTRTYESDYHVTPRNGVTAGGASMSEMISIYAENKVILEPGQTYDLNVRVTGTSVQGFAIQNLSGNTDAVDTSVDVTDSRTARIRLGTNEKGSGANSSFSFDVVANADSTVSTHVEVLVRRVNAINVNGFKISGSRNKAGAVYKITATLSGTNLEKEPGAWYDVDYVNPYTSGWTFDYSGVDDSGNAVSFDQYFEVVSTGVEGNVPYVTIRQKRDLAKSPKLVVTGTALHPEGMCESGVASGIVPGTGVMSNKSGTDYDTLQGTWELEFSPWKRNGKLDIAVHHLGDENFYIEEDGTIMYKWDAKVKFSAYDSAGNLLPALGAEFDPWQREQHLPIKADLDLNNIRDKWDLTLMPYHETNNVWDWGPSYSLPYILAYYNTPVGGFNRNWYLYNASPSFVNKDLGVAGYRLELYYEYLDEEGNRVNETIYDDCLVEEVSVLYRNALDSGCSWQRNNKIYVTTADTITDYKVHFQFDKGWDQDNDDYYFIDMRRFIGVVADRPGYINDVRRDITVSGNETKEDVPDGDSVLTFTLTAADKVECKALADEADGTITMIYEYNPFLGRLPLKEKTQEELLAENPSWAENYWAHYNAAIAADPLDLSLYKESSMPMDINGVTITQDIMDSIDGCDGHVVFCFKDPNIEVRGGVTPKVMYCPTVAEYGTVYYIDDVTRFVISNSAAQYQELISGSWTTTSNMTWDEANSRWIAN